MRSVVLLPILPLVRGQFTPNDGCRFVGAHFAKTESVCSDDSSDGFCMNVFRLMDTGQFFPMSSPFIQSTTRTVSCDEAAVVATEYIKDFCVEFTDSVDDSDVPELFRTRINPAIKRLWLGGVELDQRVFDSMKIVYSLAVNAVRRGITTFAMIAGEPEIEEFNSLIEHLIYQSTIESINYDVLSGSLAPVFSFWFDLAAMFADIVMLEGSDTVPVTLQTMMHPPRHRLPYFDDAVVKFEPPAQVERAVKISSCFAHLGSQAHRYMILYGPPSPLMYITDTDLELIQHVLVLNTAASATAAILRYDLRTRLCPVLPGVIQIFRMSPGLTQSFALKIGISLIHLCRVHADVRFIFDSSLILGFLEHEIGVGEMVNLPELNIDNALEELTKDEYPWIAYASHSANFFNEDAFFENLPLERIPAESFNVVLRGMSDSPYDWKQLMRAVGRLIGLRIRAGLTLFVLALHPSQVRLIHSPSWASAVALSQALESDRTPLEILESVHYMRLGMMDTLGPGIFYATSMQEFESYFVITFLACLHWCHRHTVSVTFSAIISSVILSCHFVRNPFSQNAQSGVLLLHVQSHHHGPRQLLCRRPYSCT